MDLCYNRRAEQLDHRYLDTGTKDTTGRIILTCLMPLSEVVTDFFDQLKSRSSGFASFEYVFLSDRVGKAHVSTLIATRMPGTRKATSTKSV